MSQRPTALGLESLVLHRRLRVDGVPADGAQPVLVASELVVTSRSGSHALHVCKQHNICDDEADADEDDGYVCGREDDGYDHGEAAVTMVATKTMATTLAEKMLAKAKATITPTDVILQCRWPM